MAINTSATAPANGTAAIFTLINTLLAAGWRIKAWSDATTLTSGVSLSTNPYGTSGSGAGNLGNTSAWFRIAAGDGSREWMFQRGSADTNWGVYRSVSGFTTGGNATTVSTNATDGYTFQTNANGFIGASPGRWLISVNTSDYTWCAFNVAIGGGNSGVMLGDDSLMAGTYPTSPVADADPYVSFFAYLSAGATTVSFSATSTGVCMKRFRHGLASASNVKATASSAVGIVTSGTVQGLGPIVTSGNYICVEPYNSAEVPILIPVYAYGSAASTTTGWVGYQNGWRASTITGRATGQTLNFNNATYWIYAVGWWVPWDSSTPTI